MVGPLSIKNIQQQEISGGLRLHITFPANTPVSKDQLEATVRLLPYDAIIVVGASDLEELGPTFTANADFFYNTPMINIDHRASNEQFGTVNLVDITSGSCAEVVFDLLSSRLPNLLSSDIATALYAGIVAGTDSFQKPSTTPRSFQVAANLIELQAQRELVIQYLVKTKPLKLIKLAGSVYAHLRHEEQVRLYWTILEKNDFIESGASTSDIPAVMQELSNNIAGFNAAFLLYEDPASTPLAPSATADRTYHAYLLLGHGLRPRRREIQEMLSATKENGALIFKVIAPSIEAAETKAHEKIKQILP
jgi:nanoRNase/pAp phosphatase (c-di-AMP/oligoRNAs hydrolase)